jgi:hypothetical protein
MVAVASIPVHAETLPAQANWIIDLSNVSPQLEARKGKVFLQVPVYPEKIISIDGPVIDVMTTGVKVSQGKQFIEYRLSNHQEVFCSSKTLDFMKDGGSIFYFRYEGTYVCLVDQNQDGKLDGVYEVKSSLGSGTPIVTHGKSDGFEEIEPVAYHQIDRKNFDNPMSFSYRWFKGNGVNDSFLLVASLKAATGSPLEMSRYGGLNAGSFPGTFAYTGLQFEVSGEKPKLANVRVSALGQTVSMTTFGSYVGFSGN